MRNAIILLFLWSAAILHAQVDWKPEENFRFQNGDSVGIGVFRNSKPTKILMKKVVTLDGTGKAQLENGKNVKIGFGNVKSAIANIEEGYRTGDDISGLDVEAYIFSHGNRAIVTLLGEVRTPGHGAWRDGMTLADVAEAAGGFKSGADLKRGVIQRGDSSLTVDCRDKAEVAKIQVTAGDLILVALAPLKF